MATIKSKAKRRPALGVALTGQAAVRAGEHGRGGRRCDSDQARPRE